MRGPAGLVRGEEVHGVQHRVGRRLAKLQHQAHYRLPPQATAASVGTETCAVAAGGKPPQQQEDQVPELQNAHSLRMQLNYLESFRHSSLPTSPSLARGVGRSFKGR